MKRTTDFRLRARVSLSISAMIVLGTARAQSYTYATINAPNDPFLLGTVVSSINNSGQTAGYYVTYTPQGAAYSAFTGNSDGSSFTTLSRAGTIALGASGINSSGEIVGVSVDMTDTATGFLRDAAGNYTTIDPALGGLTSGYSEAVGINDSGTIVGFYSESAPSAMNPEPPEHGFIDNHGVYTSVDFPGGYQSSLDTINNEGTMTGGFYDASGNQQSFIYNANTGFTEISVAGYSQTSVSGVNDLGEYVVGGLVNDSHNLTGVDSYSFLYSGGSYHAFGVPGAISTAVYSINDVGQISGYYVDAHETIHGFVATPMATPEPMPCLTFGVMAGGVLLRRRRRPQA